MHHADSSGDTPGSRKMAHSSVFPGRRGSNTGGSNLSALTTTASMSCNVITADDHQSPLIMQHVPPSGSSSPGPHHPPHSLNINAQPQSLQSAGAQVKKKSGFQITSVLPAQVSASANNSIADDTESYDDMDESHTEDLSSSDILDVSVSRATDRGVPERSSSEETLNSLHGVETPGITSPNEPVLHHTHPQASQQGYMVNGTVHPHPQHHHGAPQEQALHSAAAPPQVTPQSGRAAGAPAALAIVGTAAEAITQPAAAQLSQTPRASQARAAAPEVSAAGAVTQPVSATMTSGGGTGMTGGAAGSGFNAAGGGLASTAGPTTSTPAGAAVKAQPPPPANTSASSTQAPMAAGSTATASRFRVVKLDSSSEPFRKGRWTCTEYYEKEAAQAPPPLDAPPAHRVVEGLAQLEGDNSSGSSGSSTLSGSGGTFQSPGTEGGAQPGPQVYAPALAGAPLAQPPLQQPAQQYHPHPQEAVAPPSQPAMVPPTSLQPAPLTGLEAQASTTRPQTPYTLEQPGSVNQGSIQTGDFSQPLQGTIAPGHQLPPASGGAMTRGAPGIVGVAGSSAGGPAAVPQVVSPRPTQAQPPASQIGLVPGGGVAQLQQILQEKPQANTQPLPPASVTSRQTVPSMLQGHLQPDLSRAAATLLHGGGTVGHAGVLGLALGHPGALQGQLPSGAELHAGAGMGAFTASQLEDAHRLLFQHQNLLGFPKLAAAGVAGLAGQSASIAGAASGQEGGAGMDASALLTAVGTEEDSSSGASVVAIDNKIEQAMDLVKSHLMYAVREEVEVLKEQIKELIERNSQLEQENNLLKNLASPEQLAQFQAQVQIGSPTSGTAQLGMLNGPPGAPQSLPPSQQGMGPTA